MFVQSVSNHNYQPNFLAMKIVNKNPNISKDLRKLAEKATDLIENIHCKKIDVDGVRIGIAANEKNSFYLSKVINNKNIDLAICKNFVGGTELSLNILSPRSKYINRIRYGSFTSYKNPEKHGYPFLWGESFTCDRFCIIGMKSKTNRKPYTQKNAQELFINYLSELLESASKIKQLFK